MKHVLVLGAGLVAKPLVDYLAKKPDTKVTVASRTVSKAEKLVHAYAHCQAKPLNLKDDAALEKEISAADIVISLVPYTFHTKVARYCIAHGKDMVTTSYVSQEMADLHKQAEDKGILILNEIGLDPGIDHMSAMKIIHEIEDKGGHVESFRSFCGGLPAPDDNDNPWGYKFSWSPRGVVMAGKNTARWLEEGKEINVPGPQLFANHWPMHIDPIGSLEFYPNRDSVPYIDKYGLHQARTMFRGTIRYPGWCKLWLGLVKANILDDTPLADSASLTYKQWLARTAGVSPSDVRSGLAAKLGIAADSAVIEKMEWLGLFADDKIGLENTASMDILVHLLLEKLTYKPGEKDMIILHHEFIAAYATGKEKVLSTLVDFGVPHGETSMSRTVSLPAAIATGLILDGRIKAKGVKIPVHGEIYLPVLSELKKLGISFEDKTIPQ